FLFFFPCFNFKFFLSFFVFYLLFLFDLSSSGNDVCLIIARSAHRRVSGSDYLGPETQPSPFHHALQLQPTNFSSKRCHTVSSRQKGTSSRYLPLLLMKSFSF